MDNIVSTQRRVAEMYFNDGSIEMACPALKALLHIMRDDKYEGKDLTHPEIRALFTPASLLGSEWYQERLQKAVGRTKSRCGKITCQLFGSIFGARQLRRRRAAFGA